MTLISFGEWSLSARLSLENLDSRKNFILNAVSWSVYFIHTQVSVVDMRCCHDRFEHILG